MFCRGGIFGSWTSGGGDVTGGGCGGETPSSSLSDKGGVSAPPLVVFLLIRISCV